MSKKPLSNEQKRMKTTNQVSYWRGFSMGGRVFVFATAVILAAIHTYWHGPAAWVEPRKEWTWKESLTSLNPKRQYEQDRLPQLMGTACPDEHLSPL